MFPSPRLPVPYRLEADVVQRYAAALATGNAVVAKLAEQTPGIALKAVRLLHAAGVPAGVLQLARGPGDSVGAALVAARGVAGVVFTGSTQVARTINRALAAKDRPITPLIAETGGINAMLVDSIGAVVGVRPFGGEGLSGTGP